MNRAVLAFCFATLTACSTPQPSATQHREPGVVLLDNHGGFSHGGHRIELHPDGSYNQSTYSDVIGDDHTKHGRYTLTGERTLLTLSPHRGGAQRLYRVDYRGKQYWVRADERTRITKSDEDWLRQVSLRVIP